VLVSDTGLSFLDAAGTQFDCLFAVFFLSLFQWLASTQYEYAFVFTAGCHSLVLPIQL